MVKRFLKIFAYTMNLSPMQLHERLEDISSNLTYNQYLLKYDLTDNIFEYSTYIQMLYRYVDTNKEFDEKHILSVKKMMELKLQQQIDDSIVDVIKCILDDEIIDIVYNDYSIVDDKIKALQLKSMDILKDLTIDGYTKNLKMQCLAILSLNITLTSPSEFIKSLELDEKLFQTLTKNVAKEETNLCIQI